MVRRHAAARVDRRRLGVRAAALIMNEPTTALDVTVEAQILEVLTSLRRGLSVGTLFISRSLGVVRRVCEQVIVM